MKKENGFIAISMIYSVFVLFVMILIAVMFSYISDRKSSNRIKEDIKNQFSIGTPMITLSQEGSETSSASYTVRINVTQGKFPVGEVKYIFSTSRNASPANDVTLSNGVGTVTLSNTSYPGGKYYLNVKACDINNNCELLKSKMFVLSSAS